MEININPIRNIINQQIINQQITTKDGRSYESSRFVKIWMSL